VILGYDNDNPSQQLNRITVRNNVVSDMGWPWDGSGYFLTLLGQPHEVIIDHNTIISEQGAGVITVEGPPISGFVFTNNVMRHNEYGIIGRDKGVGNDAIAYFLPGSIITRNVFADGPPLYPAGNELPSIAEFAAHFKDYGGGDYSLRPGTDWEKAGTDGLDLGATISVIGIRSPANPRLIR
jgi:hypothetical protein